MKSDIVMQKEHILSCPVNVIMKKKSKEYTVTQLSTYQNQM